MWLPLGETQEKDEEKKCEEEMWQWESYVTDE